MWIIAGHVIVEAGGRDPYVTTMADLLRRGREAPGCLDLSIAPDPLDPRRVNMFEVWETWDAVESWRAVANAPDTGIEILDDHVSAYEIAAVRPPF